MTDPFGPRSYYDTLTDLYGRLFGTNWHLGYWLRAGDFAEAGRRLNELMIAKLAVGAGATVVDVGCGVGGPTCDIADASGCSVVGITNSAPGVAGGERLARNRGLESRVRFQLGDMNNLPLGDATFDAAFSCEAVHNVAEKAGLVRELTRVVKPGGRIVVGDLFLRRPIDRLTISSERLTSFSFNLFLADDWIALLGQHGAEVVESIDVGHHVGAKSLDYCIATCRTQAAAAAEGTLERTILNRTVEATTLLAEGFASGDLGWGVWTAIKS